MYYKSVIIYKNRIFPYLSCKFTDIEKNNFQFQNKVKKLNK